VTALTAVDYERRRTWALTIAAELLRKDGAAVPFHDEGKERCRAGGFRFCRQSSTWYSFATDRGGLSATSLIRFLRPDYTREDASAWLASFLGANPGVGQLEAEDEEWTPTRREAVAALCRHRLDTGEKVLPPGSPGATYRASRGLPEAASEGMLWIANARPGEGALIMPLIAFDCITGTLETYINALGRKSLALPNRRRLDLEPAPGAVMEIAAASPGTIDIRVDVITCEGWENEESITLVKSPAWRVLALPGINTMKHLPSVLKPEERRVIAFQRLPSEGASRPQASGGRHRCPDRCRQASQGDPAFGAGRRHSILQSEGLGEKELSRLTACAGSAALSFEGKVAELPKLPETIHEDSPQDCQDARGTCRVPRSRSCQAPAETVEDRLPICLEDAGCLGRGRGHQSALLVRPALRRASALCRVAAADGLPDGCRRTAGAGSIATSRRAPITSCCACR
jgi:hypothetical protein